MASCVDGMRGHITRRAVKATDQLRDVYSVFQLSVAMHIRRYHLSRSGEQAEDVRDMCSESYESDRCFGSNVR